VTALNVEKVDRRIKWALLIVSLATLVLLAISALRENVFATWRLERGKYGKILNEKASNEREQALAAQFRTEIVQHVLPELNVVDRCVTCHTGLDDPRMTAETNPHKTHPGDFLVTHPPEKFGCVSCHGGQGRATEKDDAHGHVPYWPSPRIEKPHLYAGCGGCHTYVGVPNLAMIERGKAAAEQYRCMECHRIDGAGGSAQNDAPDLSETGIKGPVAKTRSVSEHGTCFLYDPAAAIPESDRNVLEQYLATRTGAPDLIAAKALFHSEGCLGCHQVAGVGGDEGPDLTRVGEKEASRLDFSHVPGDRTLANWFKAHLRAPALVVPGSQMPELGLDEEKANLLTLYLLSLRRGVVSPALWPKDRVRTERLGEREFATDGWTLFTSFCAACHGSEGQGIRYRGLKSYPAIGGSDFLAAAPDAFIRTAVTQGRPGRRMPAWGEKKGGLRPDEIDAIITALRERAGQPEPEDEKPARWVAAPAPGIRPGNELYMANCAGCHGTGGEGGEGLALNDPGLLRSATDTYLVTTISKGRRGTKMQGFAQASPTHPALTPREIESIVWFIRSWEDTK